MFSRTVVWLVDALIDNAQAILADNPRSGRIVPETGNPDMRELIYRGYRIVYRLKGEVLEILTVFEGHRLLRLNESGDQEKVREFITKECGKWAKWVLKM